MRRSKRQPKHSYGAMFCTTCLKILLSALPMVVMMVVIFVMSHQAGVESAGTSEGIGKFIVEILDIEVPPDLTPSTVAIFFGLNIRKLAHIFLYALLGGTSFLFMASLPIKVSAHIRPAIYAAGAVIISFLYACSDEFHQSFVAGRDGKFADVGVDAIGFLTVAILVMAVWYLVLWFRSRRAKGMTPPERNGDI